MPASGGSPERLTDGGVAVPEPGVEPRRLEALRAARQRRCAARGSRAERRAVARARSGSPHAAARRIPWSRFPRRATRRRAEAHLQRRRRPHLVPRVRRRPQRRGGEEHAGQRAARRHRPHRGRHDQQRRGDDPLARRALGRVPHEVRRLRRRAAAFWAHPGRRSSRTVPPRRAGSPEDGGDWLAWTKRLAGADLEPGPGVPDAESRHACSPPGRRSSSTPRSRSPNRRARRPRAPTAPGPTAPRPGRRRPTRTRARCCGPTRSRSCSRSRGRARPEPWRSTGARVITMAGGNADAMLENSTVVVAGNRIAAVGPTGRIVLPPGTRTFDARGRRSSPADRRPRTTRTTPTWACCPSRSGRTAQHSPTA